MKKIFILLVAFMATMPVLAYDFLVDGIYYNISSGKVYVTNGSTKYLGDVIIPASVTYNDNTYAVTAIGSQAFYGCSSLTSVTIPSSVTYINSDAFRYCSSLTSITIPNSVTSISSYSFADCSSLTSVTIPNSVTSIGSNAFAYCTSLTSITLPNALKTISDNLFKGCSALSSVEIPNSVTKIQTAAFMNCSYLATITIPNSVQYIDNEVFAGVKGLLVYCEGTTPASISSNVIDQSAMFVVPNPDVYKAQWGVYASQIVANNYLLEKDVTITAHAEKSALHQALGLDVLKQTYKLKVRGSINSYDIMMIRNQMPLLRELDLSEATIVANAYEYTKGYCSKDYTITTQSFTGTGTKILKAILPNNLKAIEAGAFNSIIGEIVITSNDVRTIPANAFYDCSGLTTVTLPDSLETIGAYAFQATGLRAITLPANVSSLGAGAFAGMRSSDNNYYYPSSTSNAEESYRATSNAAFSEGDRLDRCVVGSLREVTIPKNSKLKTIPSRAFEGNGSLTKLNILGDSITTIEDVAFRGCALDTLILPPNLKSISTLSFGDCSGLKYIVMPKSLTEVPANAFIRCTNLKDIQFSSKLTSIGHHAFADCTNLSNVDIPGLVSQIGDYAFKDCNVKSVHSYLFDPFTIGQNTFSPYANANATLYIPNVEDTEMKYLYDTQWSQFLNRVRLDKDFEYEDFYTQGDLTIGSGDDPIKGEPDAEIKPGSGLVVEDGSTQQNLGTITLHGNHGDWASILAGCNLNVDTLILKIKVKGNKWHFFGFPFKIKMSELKADGKFVVYEYDGKVRADRDTTGWKKILDKQSLLLPGKGYIFQFNFQGEKYFSIKVSKPNFCQMMETIKILLHPSAKPNNKHWNYLSNPFFAYYDIDDLNYTGPITFWDVEAGTYKSLRPGDDVYFLSPYEAFFLQNIEENEAELTFSKEKGMTKKQKDEKKKDKDKPKKAPAKVTVNNSRSIINLTLTNGVNADETRVVINEQAMLGYDLGYDAAKFMTTENNVPQIFSYDAAQTMCAINERPMANGTVDLGIKIPTAGTYQIVATRMDTALYLLDRQENITHNLQNGNYYFEASAGMNTTRFALVRTPQHAPTDLENVEQTTIQATDKGLLVTGNANIQVYTVAGLLITEGELSGLVPLAPGVYMVVNNGITSKYVIK